MLLLSAEIIRNKISRLFEKYLFHIRTFHSYNKMDQITRKSWLEI